MTIKELILSSDNEQAKALFAEFDKEPYDYAIYSPLNLDEDEASLSVYLKIGTDKCKKKVNLHLQVKSVSIDVTNIT